MLDFLTAIPAEWIAIALFFLASMQGADGTSWLAALVAKLTTFVVPKPKSQAPDGADATPAGGAKAGAIGFQNIISLLIPLIPVLLPLIQGCGDKPKAADQPAVTNQVSEWEDSGRAGQIVNLGSGGAVGMPVTFCSGVSNGQSAWAWADGETGGVGDLSGGGFYGPDAGASGPAGGPGFSSVGQRSCSPAACSGCASGPARRPTVYAARPLAYTRSGGWHPGKRIVGVARLAARPLRWLRLPGRPLARLFGRR
jgi:hypothetical protein